MAIKNFSFKVDFITKNSLCMAHVKQNDNAVFNIYLTQQGQALDLTGQQVRLFVRKPDGKLVVQDKDIVITDVKGGAIRVNVQNSIFQAVGVAVCEIDIWGVDKNNASSGSFLINIDEQLGNNKAVESHVDVNLFRQLTEYIDEANADILKYKTLFEGFVKAGVSLQGLNDIKAYIDNNLAGLKAQGDRAVELIPQVNKARTDAEAKRVEVVNITATAEAKRKEVVDVTSKAEAKRTEVVNVIATADASKNALNGSIGTGNSLKAGLDASITSGNSTKTALDSATSTANTKKAEVVTVTNNAEQKRIQVVAVTDSAEAKRKELQGTIDTIGNSKVVLTDDFIDKTGNTYTSIPCYNFDKGVLVDTAVPAGKCTMFTVRITGNSYGQGMPPIDCLFNFYDYTAEGGIISCSGGTVGTALNLKVFRHEGKIKLWTKQTKDYQTLIFEITPSVNLCKIKPTYVNQTMPTTGLTCVQEIVPTKPNLYDLIPQATVTDANTYESAKIWTGKTEGKMANTPLSWGTVINFGASSNTNGQMAWNYDTNALKLCFRKRHDASGEYGTWEQIYHTGYKPTLSELGAMGAKQIGEYFGMSAPAGNDSNWLRTTKLGLIPYQAGVESALGTKDWKFREAWIDTIKAGLLETTRGVASLDAATGKYIKMGTGASDVYVCNSKSNAYLQLKDDGRLCYKDAEVACGKTEITYDNGTHEQLEGRVHIGGDKYLYYGWFGISLAGASAVSRTYAIPKCRRIHTVLPTCYSKDAEYTYGELGVLGIADGGFTVRLYNSRTGGQHYVSYMAIGE